MPHDARKTAPVQYRVKVTYHPFLTASAFRVGRSPLEHVKCVVHQIKVTLALLSAILIRVCVSCVCVHVKRFVYVTWTKRGGVLLLLELGFSIYYSAW